MCVFVGAVVVVGVGVEAATGGVTTSEETFTAGAPVVRTCCKMDELRAAVEENTSTSPPPPPPPPPTRMLVLERVCV